MKQKFKSAKKVGYVIAPLSRLDFDYDYYRGIRSGLHVCLFL